MGCIRRTSLHADVRCCIGRPGQRRCLWGKSTSDRQQICKKSPCTPFLRTGGEGVVCRSEARVEGELKNRPSPSGAIVSYCQSMRFSAFQSFSRP